ncbi:MAG: translocase [Polyangiaceae bacterium]|nr:translocase [Polyangiaceae bacterium]
MNEPTPPHHRSALERLLGVVTRVEPGEGVSALLMTLNVLTLMTAYSAIKPVREGLILAMASGAEYKAYMGGAIAVALLFAVPAYARFADRLPRNRLVVGVTLFFAANLVLFWAGSTVEAVRARLGLVYYLWLGIFNMMVVAQFWAFANDLYRAEQGKRLFALLGVGQTLGAVLGAGLSVWLLARVGVFNMLLVGAGLLGVTATLTQVVHAREQRSPAPPRAADPGDHGGAFELVLKSGYLRHVAAFALLFTFVNSNGEYVLGRLVKAAAEHAVQAGTLSPGAVKEWVGDAYSRFYLYTNVATVTIQALVVSRLVRVWGFERAFYVLPVIALFDALGAAALPVLAVVFVGKVAENATDYSLNNTLRNMLWLPTTREMKYKAKQAVDTFFVRMGDVSSALVVFLLASQLHLGVRAFALVNVGLVVVWLVLARKIVAGYVRLSAG